MVDGLKAIMMNECTEVTDNLLKAFQDIWRELSEVGI